jgi:uncharacterized protein (DUF2267 family)
MTDWSVEDRDDYYRQVMLIGKLRSTIHAKRWSDGVLKTLGTSLDRGTKRALGKSLPDELSSALYGVFWLLHFRDDAMTRLDFQNRVARRSGNSDKEFAFYPTRAVFGEIKRFVDSEVEEKVAESLSPDIRELWNLSQPTLSARHK